MILRRFMQHTKEQNWFAVGLDVIVVIVGIFLGMQVTEWNEKRIAKEKHTQNMTELNTDISLALERVDFGFSSVGYHERLLSSLRWLLKPESISESKFECFTILNSNIYNEPFEEIPSLEQMVSDPGQLQLLDEELKIVLQDLYYWRMRNIDSINRFRNRSHDLIKNYPQHFSFNWNWEKQTSGFALEGKCKADQMRNDPIFLGALQLNINYYETLQRISVAEAKTKLANLQKILMVRLKSQ